MEKCRFCGSELTTCTLYPAGEKLYDVSYCECPNCLTYALGNVTKAAIDQGAYTQERLKECGIENAKYQNNRKENEPRYLLWTSKSSMATIPNCELRSL